MTSPPPSPPAPRRRRRLSLTRLGLVIGVAAAGTVAVRHSFAERASAGGRGGTWFAPYVDVALPPSYAFGDTRFNPAPTAVLGFVVAAKDGSCTPTWAGIATPDQAASTFDLDRRLEVLHRRGGEPVVSFGGAANTDLALACHDTAGLAAAYETVLRRYSTSAVDLDIEGAALHDASARDRRAQAIAQVQHDLGSSLRVWLTLPVGRDGLDDDGLATVAAFLSAKVDVAGINAMTMDFGTRQQDEAMSDLVIGSTRATATQVRAVYGRFGITIGADAVWDRIGLTVMIGRNDIPDEVVTLADAGRIAVFATDVRLARVSMWSLNRDAECGTSVDGGVAQNGCSGVAQDPIAFATLFAERFHGGPNDVVPSAGRIAARSVAVLDDPATAPYPIWRAGATYVGGDKTVWQGNVYEAKWWNQNAQPDMPVEHVWDTPWSLVGPVLPTDRPAPTSTVPAGLYGAWDPSVAYRAGSRIEIDGVVYEAKWWTQGDRPGGEAASPSDTPWVRLELSASQVAAIVQGAAAAPTSAVTTTAVATTSTSTSTPNHPSTPKASLG